MLEISYIHSGVLDSHATRGQLVASALARHARAAIIDEARRIPSLPLAVKGMWIVSACRALAGTQSSRNAECAPAEKTDAQGARFSRLVHTRCQRDVYLINPQHQREGQSPLNRSARYCSVQGCPSRPVSRTRRVHLKAEVPLPQPTNALCSNLHGKNHPSRRIFQGKETHPCVPVAQLVGLAACSKLSLPSTSTIDTRFLKLLQNSSRCFVNAIHSCGE